MVFVINYYEYHNSCITLISGNVKAHEPDRPRLLRIRREFAINNFQLSFYTVRDPSAPIFTGLLSKPKNEHKAKQEASISDSDRFLFDIQLTKAIVWAQTDKERR